MDYVCPVCGEVVPDQLTVYIRHTEDHIIDIVKQAHPEWVEQDGLCRKCLDYYRRQIKGGDR